MAGKRRANMGRRAFLRTAGGTAAGAVVVGGGAFTANAAGVPAVPAPVKPDPFGGMPRSLALSLPGPAGAVEPPLPPLPDQLEGGTITAPSSSRATPYADAPPNPAAVRAAVPTELPFEFKTSGYEINTELPDYMRPWRDRPTAWSAITPDTEKTYLDAKGVIKYRPSRTAAGYDQPVTQIQFGLGCISGYRKTTDPERKKLFLKRAVAQAQQQIDRRVESRGAWYIPYPFNFSLDGHPGVTYRAPWYSGMAQGEAISLFIQLSQIPDLSAERRQSFRTAADAVFASLLLGDDGRPWAVNKDKKGYLWIQEYPGATPGTGDYTFNGMIFAMFGLWDYYAETRNPLAAKLYDGCVTTIRDHYSRLRNPRWHAFYCHTHRVPAPSYHQHHINLLRQLHWQTGSPVLANQQDGLLDDFPPPAVKAGSVIAFAKGTHTLYKLDTLGEAQNYGWHPAKADRQLATKKVTFNSATQAPVSTRRRIQGRGVYYRISAGSLAGWWVGEYYPKVFVRGEYCATDYLPQRTATFRAGTSVSCVKFGTNGAEGSTKTMKFTVESKAPFDRRAYVNGRSMVRITAGAFKGYWAPCSQIRMDG